MLDIIDLEGRREAVSGPTYPTNQGGFDLIWNNGPVRQFDRPTSLPSLLGCFNPKDQNQARQPLLPAGPAGGNARPLKSTPRSSTATNASRSSCGPAGRQCSIAEELRGKDEAAA